jgi:NAD(P)-dependent dehydrogenase (short-subunit alcohol dehydrogenase family)
LHTELEQRAPGAALMAPLDLEKALASDYDRIADAVQQRYGKLDGLVHCAGLLGTLTPIEQYDVPTWCRVVHVNLTAAFVLTQVLLPLLRSAPDGSIIFTSSGVGRKGRAYWGAYAVAKFGVEGLMQVLADELSGTSKVRVNAINPGRARTAMRRQAYPSENVESLPLPETLLEPYLKLLGPRGAGITGQSLDSQP